MSPFLTENPMRRIPMIYRYQAQPLVAWELIEFAATYLIHLEAAGYELWYQPQVVDSTRLTFDKLVILPEFPGLHGPPFR
jgi:hypothetical protein